MGKTNIQIVEVQNNRGISDFHQLPFLINKGCVHWVPPLLRSVKLVLNKKKNPFWKNNDYQLFVAYQNGIAVGRIAAIASKESGKEGAFGFLEAHDNYDTFKILIDTASDWLKDRGCKYLQGPFNPNLHQELGVLVNGFEHDPFLMMTYNPNYYHKMLQRVGMEKASDFFAYRITRQSFQPQEKVQRVYERLSNRMSLKLRAGNLKKFDEEMAIIRELYNEAFSGHWGFTPITKEEFDFMGKELKSIIDTDLVLIAEYNGNPIGFLLAVPNLNLVLKKIKDGKLFPFGVFKLLFNSKKINSARVMLLCIKKRFQPLGIGSIFYYKFFEKILQSNYQEVEIGWVVEDNLKMNAATKLIGGEKVKTYRIYKKQIA